MNDSKDRELIDRIAARDEMAMRALFARFSTRTFRYLCRMVRNEAVAEELTNEAFLDVWRNADRFEGRSSVSTWIIAIARNRALSLLRKRHDEELSEGVAERTPDDSDNPEVSAAKRSKAEIIRSCIERLSSVHREILDLVYYHEASIVEASEILGIPANTVKTRMFNARKNLSVLLLEAGIDRGWP